MFMLLLRQPLQFGLHLWLNIGQKVFQRLMFPMEHCWFSRKGLKIISVFLGKPPSLVDLIWTRFLMCKYQLPLGVAFCFIAHTLPFVTLLKTTKNGLIFICFVCITASVFTTGLMYSYLFPLSLKWDKFNIPQWSMEYRNVIW